MRVLVTYVSPHGSTAGIADHIAMRLREAGLVVDCHPARDSQELADYDAVLVGSAIHGQAWLPEASGFLRSHADQLRAKPVWLYSVGMPASLPRVFRGLAAREGPKAVAPFADLVRPRDTRLFSGVVGKQQSSPFSRAVLRLMGGHYGDFRDWQAVDTWSADIAAALPQ